MITPEYAAGFMDGEGTFTLYSRPGNDNRHRVMRQIVCGNTYLPVLVALRDTYGGKIYSQPTKATVFKTAKPSWKWVISDVGTMVPFLEAIIPHLLEKRARAEELLASCRLANRSCGAYTRKRPSLRAVGY